MKRLILFDLDGTLIDSLPDIAAALNRALADWGRPQRSLAEVRRFIGSGTRKLIERACHGDVPPGLMEAYRDYYDKHLLDQTTVYPGMSQLLNQLRADHLAVVTNKYQSAAERIVGHFFPDTFDIVIGDGRFGRKPDPAAIHYLMAHFAVPGQATWLIGDSRVDRETAISAGIHFIAVDWGYDILKRAVNLTALKQQLLPSHNSGQKMTEGK